MNWADADGVSYLAWGWWVLGNTSTQCSALGDPGDNYALVSDYAGTAVSPDGTNLRTHLAALAAATGLEITAACSRAATVKVKYSTTLTATGGNPPYKWSVSSGRLPAGLHLRTSGVVSGKPKVSGTFEFTVKVVDHTTKTKPHTQRTATKTLSITIG